MPSPTLDQFMPRGLTPDQFFLRERDKALRLLHSQYDIPNDDASDIVSDSFLTLHDNIQTGRLTHLTAPLSSYFQGVCRLKALEFLRGKGKTVHIDDDSAVDEAALSRFDGSRIEEILAGEEDDEKARVRKAALVRHAVATMPEPCNRLLWDTYALEYSTERLLALFNYKNAHTLTQTRSRCVSKFRAYFNELYSNLLNA